MPTNLDNELVIGIASSALFDLTESHNVFMQGDVDEYRSFQRRNRNVPLEPGPAFEFIRKLLDLNVLADADGRLVDVVLLSRNSPETGYRVMHSIQHHGLDIKRAVFTEGASPYIHHQAFAIDLFLSENADDVREAIRLGLPAGRVVRPRVPRPSSTPDFEVRIAFDFDGVVGDDASEQIYAAQGLEAFQIHESDNQDEPVMGGPIQPFFMAIAHLQDLDRRRAEDRDDHERKIRLSIVTSRNIPAELRVLNTLDSWGVNVDDAFFMGGLPKGPVLRQLEPDIFFDDQTIHVEDASEHTMSAHVIFGVRNEASHEV
jgi:5'-nucleotidase